MFRPTRELILHLPNALRRIVQWNECMLTGAVLAVEWRQCYIPYS